MALPVVTAGVRLAKAIAKHAGKTLKRRGKQGYKLAKSKKARTQFAKATTSITKRNLYSIKRGVSTAATSAIPGAKRHLKFYAKIASPQGKQFRYLVNRPTFGQRVPFKHFPGITTKRTTHGMKLRAKLLKGGIYGGYIYGASKFRS